MNASIFQQYRQYHLENSSGLLRITYSQPAGDPDGFSLSIISVENRPYLQVKADHLNEGKGLDIRFSYTLSPSGSLFTINTIDPLMHEPVFFPKNNRSRFYRSSYFTRNRYHGDDDLISQTATEYVYDIPVYAQYTLENQSARVVVKSGIEGRNHWMRGYDLHGINTYKDSFSLTFENRSAGWRAASGSLTFADGQYPADKVDKLPSVPPVQWKLLNGSREFSPRIDHRTVVFNDHLWIIGGTTENGIFQNDVWESDTGTDWYLVNNTSGFPAREGFCSVTFNDSIWVIGGRTTSGGYRPENSIYKNDIWNSSDGNVWTPVTPHAAFSGRSGHQCVVFHDKIWVIGGTAEQDVLTSTLTIPNGSIRGSSGVIRRVNFSDVWYSNDGIDWTAATLNAPFGERVDHRAVIFNDKIWILNGQKKSDLWSSANGTRWFLVSDDLPFNYNSRLLREPGFVVFDDKIWVIAGYGEGFSSDLDTWYSNDGKSWTPLDSGRFMHFRWSHSTVVFKDRIWVIGGRLGESKEYNNDIWFSPPEMEFEPIKAPWEK